MGVSRGGERGETGSRMGGGTKERWKKKKRGRGGTNEQRSGEVEMEERSGVSHGGERGKTGTRMGGGTKERRKKKKRGRGGTHEQRSGEVEMDERSVARRGTRENGVPNGRRDEGKEEEEKRRGEEWMSGGVEGSVARRGTRENGDSNGRRSGWESRTAGNAGIGTRMGGGAGKWRSKRAQAPFSAQTGLRPCGGGGGQGQEQGQGSGAGGTLRFAVSGAGRPFAGGDERTSPAESFGRARLCCGGCRGQSPSFLRISFGRACLLTMMEVVL